MNEELEILSKEVERELSALEYHMARLRHYLKQLQIFILAKESPKMEVTESSCKCEG